MRTEITDGSTLAAHYDPINVVDWMMILGGIFTFILICSIWFMVKEMFEDFKEKREDEEIKKELELEEQLLKPGKKL